VVSAVFRLSQQRSNGCPPSVRIVVGSTGQILGARQRYDVPSKKYSDEYREQFLREALRVGGRGPYGLATERGLSAGMVHRWLSEAARLGRMPDQPRRPEDLKPEEKLRLLSEAARLNDTELGEFLRREGLQEADLTRWRDEAIGGLSGPLKSSPPSKRIRDLERELRRKDKALAETAALLVLSKKAQALWAAVEDDTDED
jgi:transposase